MENGFVPRAEGPWFLEFPYDEGRNFVSRAEGPWFVGAGRRLFVDICTIESGRDPTNYYYFSLKTRAQGGEVLGIIDVGVVQGVRRDRS